MWSSVGKKKLDSTTQGPQGVGTGGCECYTGNPREFPIVYVFFYAGQFEKRYCLYQHTYPGKRIDVRHNVGFFALSHFN